MSQGHCNEALLTQFRFSSLIWGQQTIAQNPNHHPCVYTVLLEYGHALFPFHLPAISMIHEAFSMYSLASYRQCLLTLGQEEKFERASAFSWSWVRIRGISTLWLVTPSEDKATWAGYQQDPNRKRASLTLKLLQEVLPTPQAFVTVWLGIRNCKEYMKILAQGQQRSSHSSKRQSEKGKKQLPECKQRDLQGRALEGQSPGTQQGNSRCFPGRA